MTGTKNEGNEEVLVELKSMREILKIHEKPIANTKHSFTG